MAVAVDAVRWKESVPDQIIARSIPYVSPVSRILCTLSLAFPVL
jgi:hypothetical protein